MEQNYPCEFLASTLEASERVSERERESVEFQRDCSLGYVFHPLRGPIKLCNRHHIQTDHKGRVAELGTILRPAAENIWLMGRLKRKIKPYRDDPAELDEGLD